MNNIILHVPHSSLNLPKEFLDRSFLMPAGNIDEFNKTITDLFTDDLFCADKFESIVFPHSRIFCDVEKFADDSAEVMSKYGMGVIYTHDNKGQKFFAPTNTYKNFVLQNYYYPYHNQLNNKVQTLLETSNTILIDCHSFSKDIIMTDVDKANLPDICIGVNNDFSFNKMLTGFVDNYFKDLNYKTAINYPYSGTMLPNQIDTAGKNKLCSIMIEVNKDVYLTGFTKNKGFDKLKKELYNLLNLLKDLEL